MKITALHLYPVPPRWLFLKVETDSGLAGWGEPVVEGKARTVEAAVRELEEELIGRDPRAIEDIWQRIYRGGFYRGGPVLMSALAGVDQALWDLKGKALGVPVYELLGGMVRDRLKIYGWIGGDRPGELMEAARARIQLGYGAVKLNATEEMEWIDSAAKVEAVVTRIGALREAVGREFGIAVDFHGRVHKGMAKRLARELDPLGLLFIEEPVLPENPEALREIARYTTTPIATGERLFSRWDFKRLLAEGGVDVVQPDLSHAGGISEVRRIAALAEAYDVALAPHCPLGPVAFAASLQVDFCSINAFIQETSMGIHYNEGADLLDYLKEPNVFAVKNGFLERPTGPGLGIEPDEERIREASRSGHNWKTPQWRYRDGSVAEW